MIISRIEIVLIDVRIVLIEQTGRVFVVFAVASLAPMKKNIINRIIAIAAIDIIIIVVVVVVVVGSSKVVGVPMVTHG